MFCAVTLLATVSPARAGSQAQDELQAQTAKRVRITLSALGAMDGLESESSAAAATETTTSDVSASPKRKAGCSRAESRNRCGSGTTDQLQHEFFRPKTDRPAVKSHRPAGRQPEAHPRIHSKLSDEKRRPGQSAAANRKTEVHTRASSDSRFQCTHRKSVSIGATTSLQCAAALWPRLGPIRGTFWRGRRRSSDFRIFHVWIFAQHLARRSALLPTREGIGLVTTQIFRNAYGRNAQRYRRIDVQHSRRRGLPVSTKHFDELLSARGSHRWPRV